MFLHSLLLLAALLPNLSHSASVKVGIVNGKEVIPHSRPYMVSVQINEKHHCGGFLVSNQFVMTAAHCYKRMRFTVVVGAHDLTNNNEGSRRIEVQYYHLHPEFNAKTLNNDIMLLKLGVTLSRSSTVNWISIPREPEDIPVNTVCSVAGWGQTGSNRHQSDCLLEIHTVIMNRMMCSKLWNSTYPVTEGKGDSGSPLVCGGRAEGIVSFGERICDHKEKPNVYIRISAFLPWIRSIIG
ncbi:mast cell protease 4-like isoform X2 [Hoplias malabaricus]|uniref:mast cell protease 4-like isoform X2 n=1 Tax=Hoplias malabaricus TaxID=27720 RepID=UPI0034626BE3